MIKFERSLLILAAKNAESRYMVGSFSEIFKKSNYQVLFEGIENEEEERFRQEMGIMYLQGFLYSRPISMEKLVEYLVKT